MSKKENEIIEPYVLKKYDGYCRLHLYGEVVSPEEAKDVLVRLNDYSTEMDEIEIFINSVGGYLMTTVELLNILDNFKNVITVNVGEAMSAGFLVWAKGNVRLTYKHAMFMAHRESYGMLGKTIEHRNYVQKIDDIYGKLYSELIGNILTEEEMRLFETTEVWLSADDIVGREAGIYYNDYIKGMLQIEEFYKSPISEKYYKFDGEKYIELKISEVQTYDSEIDIIKKELNN